METCCPFHKTLPTCEDGLDYREEGSYAKFHY